MSRPRKPFGSSHPGRLPATMMKVLAAEMSDPSRLRRGKQYAKDGSVLDIVIDPGTVTCEIQGSRSTPYIAVVHVAPGDGMPLRRDVQFTCTCPDDNNWDGAACKHVVATLFVLSDEFLVEPELLDVWRNREPRADDGHDADDRHVGDHDADEHTDDAADEDADDDRDADRGRVGRDHQRSARRRGHLRLVGATGNRSSERQPEPAPRNDPLADLIAAPAALPDVVEIERIEPDPPKSRDLAAVLRDALGNLRIEWD